METHHVKIDKEGWSDYTKTSMSFELKIYQE